MKTALMSVALAIVLPFCPMMQTEIEYSLNSEEVVTNSVAPPFYISTYENGRYTYITEESLITICEYIGELYSIDPVLLQSIAFVESSYRINPNKNGLCQVIPKYNLDRIDRLGIDDILDPCQNVMLCADLLKELLDCTNGDIVFALMSYNSGYYKAKELYPKTITKYPTNVLNTYEKIKGESYEF